MKRNIFIAVAVFLLSLILTDVVMAAYYINIDVTESNGTDYDMLAMNVSMDIDYLATNGFINDDGLDVRVKTSSGSSLPFMLVDDKLMFASALEGDKTTRFQMITGNTPLDSCPVIVGDGGYVTIADSANLELGDDFELEWDGYVDTSEDTDLVVKTDALEIYTDGGDIVAVMGPFTPTFVPNGAGDYANCSLFGASTNWEAVDDPPTSPDENATYVYKAGAVAAADVYNLEYSSALTDGTISSVEIYFRFCDQG